MATPASSRRATGSAAEQAACGYLRSRGLTTIQANFQCRSGEIDLIMLDRQQLVFVEVRFRSAGDYGHALDSVTPAKQLKLKRAASYFLLQHPRYGDCACRFDVVAIQAAPGQRRPQLAWIKNAFY